MSALTPGEAWSKMTLLGIGFIETKTFPGEPCARLFFYPDMCGLLSVRPAMHVCQGELGAGVVELVRDP